MITSCTDAMVILVVINNFRIEWFLVDNGSSVSLLPFYMFRKMGLYAKCLILEKSCLKGIHNSSVSVDGKIIFPIIIKAEAKMENIHREKP